MKKVQVTLPTASWGSLVTKYPPDSKYVAPSDFTDGSKNFDTSVKGVITKRQDFIPYGVIDGEALIRDQYEAIFSNGTHHLLFTAGGSISNSTGDGLFGLVSDSWTETANFEMDIYSDRVYMGNGVDDPLVYDLTTTYGDVEYTPQSGAFVNPAGCLPPEAATGIIGVDSGGEVPLGNHTYKITFVYYDDLIEESNGSATSELIEATEGNQTVQLEDVPIGEYGVIARRIYRDDDDGVWRLVGEISDNTTETYDDEASIGTSLIPTDNGLPPTFSFVVVHLDRLWMGGIAGDASTIYYSEAGRPDIVGHTNFVLANPTDPITGLVIYEDRVIVFNRNSIGQILGNSPETFRYAAIPSPVGCVDCRSIKIRAIEGIPTLVWLSARGVYQYNGNSIDYLSDVIENQLNVDIQQTVIAKGKDLDTTKANFVAGTSSDGIDLDSYSGSVTTKGPRTISGDPIDNPTNPQRTWSTTLDWKEETADLTNLATEADQALRVPVSFAPTLESGMLSNLKIDGTDLKFNAVTDFTGEGQTTIKTSFSTVYLSIAQQYLVPKAGTLTGSSIFTAGGPAVGDVIMGHTVLWKTKATGKIEIWQGNIEPSTLLTQSPVFDVPDNYGTTSKTFSLLISANTKIWVVFTQVTPYIYGDDIGTISGSIFACADMNNYYSSTLILRKSPTSNGWVRDIYIGNQTKSLSFSYTFVTSPIADSGSWESPSYNSQSKTIGATVQIINTGTYPSGTSSSLTVYGSDDDTIFNVNQIVTNLNGTTNLTLIGKQYWRITIQVFTTDYRITPTVGSPVLKFNTTGTWISAPFDISSDVDSFDALTVVSQVPSGTSVTITIATSDDNDPADFEPEDFVAVGNATPRKYVKVRVVLTTNTDGSVSPSVSQVKLKYTVLSTFESAVIDTGASNHGWDIFRQNSQVNSGTLTFEMRSAAVEEDLSGATLVEVTNGQFPQVDVLKWVQWKATLTSETNKVPKVDSVEITWFISDATPSARVASIFYNRTYYLSLAEFGSPTNNVLLVLDENNKWRQYRELDFITMGMFYNDLYCGRVADNQVVKFLEDTTNTVELDLRTKAIDFSAGQEYTFDTIQKTKLLRKVYITGLNTGAVYTVYVSYDCGVTFVSLVDPNTGSTSFTTTDDKTRFIKMMVTNFDLSQPTSGATIMLRIVESTNAPAQIHEIKLEAWIREGDVYNV